jgi:hypothetical protein
MGKDPYIAALAPIRIIAAGGFVAVSYLKSRESTADIDYLLDPEWAQDHDIKIPLREAMAKVAEQLQFSEDWINEDLSLFVTSSAREYLFRTAEEQNIVLWEGANLRIMAAPLEWVLERKLRRIHTGTRGQKAEYDMQDCIALLKCLRDRNGGPLDKNYIATLNVNSFDVVPDSATIEHVSAEYKKKFNEEIFR